MSAPYPFVRAYAAVLLAVFVVIGTGCSDSLLTSRKKAGSSGSRPETKIVPGDKTRHFGLIDRATYTRAGKTGEEETVVNLLIKYEHDGVSTQGIIDRYGIIDPYGIIDRFGIIDPYGIIDRFGIIRRFGIVKRFAYEHVFHGMAITIENERLADFLEDIRHDSEIAHVQPDIGVGSPAGNLGSLREGSTQRIPWAVDAVGGRASSSVSGDGSGSVPVDVYVLDTGAAHDDIHVSSCSRIEENEDANTGYALVDCATGDENGHGTAVASLAGAIDDRDGLVGVAPGVRIHAVKVLDEDGSGTSGAVIAALDRIISNHGGEDGRMDRPIVVNLSLGADVSTSDRPEDFVALDEAVEGAIEHGAVVTVAAGNGGKDVRDFSPARVPAALTVGSSGRGETFSRFSNYGERVDVLAPGENVETLWGPNDLRTYSGTSISAPQAAGAAALYLARNPNASPRDVHDAIVESASGSISGPGGTYLQLDVSGF